METTLEKFLVLKQTQLTGSQIYCGVCERKKPLIVNSIELEENKSGKSKKELLIYIYYI